MSHLHDRLAAWMQREDVDHNWRPWR
jgi:hypothetical protein